MPVIPSSIIQPTMDFTLSPDMSQLVRAIAKANGDTLAETVEKALALYDRATLAKTKGQSVGCTNRPDSLHERWIF